MLDLWKIRRIRRDGLPWLNMPIQRDPGVEVLISDQISSPLTCGLRKAAVILPKDARDWDELDLRRAMVHELEHVRRGDWLTQVIARVVCACYWFHPLVWVGWRRLRLEAERACDDAVVRTSEATDYAEQLVSLAERMSTAPAASGMANRSDLSKRVTAVLDPQQRRGRATRWMAACALGVAAVIAVAIAPLEAVAQSKILRSVSALDRALYEAAEQGDLQEVTKILNAGANVNAIIEGDGTPLIGAARKGNVHVVSLLLTRGADPNLASPGDGNPLIMAAREGQEEVVWHLLDRGAKIDEIVPEDENPLIQASARGHLTIVKILVSRGANVNARAFAESAGERPNGEWRTPLSMARKGGHAKVEAYLRSVGARE
jgi:hypothetical protein